ncbi:MAG: EAL domain-containing protein [Rhodocyclales bacterium]|nr:EAL domain-containing protein [Rhodocyclales bacterium]
MLGMFTAAMQFAVWPSFAVILATLTNSAVNSGMRGIGASIAALLAGMLAGVIAFGFRFSAETSPLTTAICALGLIAYVLLVGKLAFTRNTQLRHIRQRLNAVLDGVESGVVTVSEQGKVETFNRSAREIFGHAEADILGRSFSVLLDEGELEAFDADLRAVLLPGEGDVRTGLEREIVGRRRDGAPFQMAIGYATTQSEGRTLVIITVRDISARKAAEIEMRIAATAFDSNEGMVVTDANGIILRVNRAFSEITGYAADEVVGRNPSLLKSGRHDQAFYREMWHRLLTTGAWEGEIWDRRKSGEIYPKWLTIAAVRDQAGQITHFVGAHQDITERKRSEDRIVELAYFDQLTGLPNRTLLLDRLRQATATSARSGNYCALLFIDLDNFKSLNDTLGHDQGDLLLKLVARRLRQCVRAGDTVARLGGDEFVAVLLDMGSDLVTAGNHTETVGEKILAELNDAYPLGGHAHHITPSIGVTLFRGEQDAIDDLLKQADLAMYKAKEAGRNAMRFFDPRMETAAHERAGMERDLRLALRAGEFVLHYQALVDADGRVTGAEALVRWSHFRRGLVSPARFIGLAEETGLILPLGDWIVRTACQQLASWSGVRGMENLTLSVNVSAKQFRSQGFVATVLDALGRSGARPGRLKLEITESALAENVEDMIAKMNALKSAGIGFALDDFGTGYSSLSYLKRLPLDQLKIDQSFVRDILVDPNDAAIARTVVALAASLGLGVVAEGVETAEQRDILARMGCRAYQGNFFARPLPIEEFERHAGQAGVTLG